ncbi:MAG: TraR/DksA C4-type zinc finger protein [Halobacteriovoraceae bacterium]|nr:TraR/DksA C4-type zinc finger protein [Halobacteriovoraceae bacterium]
MERENSYLSDEQIEILKGKLLRERERLSISNGNSDDFYLDKNELMDPLDEASINIQASQALRFRNREIFYLKKINKTLALIESEDYGLCVECGAEISFERLNARPTAELCINCKEESEFTEKNNFYQRKSKSLGKTISEMGR